MDKVLPSLDESEPVHGDLDAVLYLTDVHKVVGTYTLCICEGAREKGPIAVILNQE